MDSDDQQNDEERDDEDSEGDAWDEGYSQNSLVEALEIIEYNSLRGSSLAECIAYVARYDRGTAKACARYIA